VLTTAVTTVGRGRYDVIIADLLYTQLLFPALLDAGLPGPVVGAALNERGTQLTRLAVQRLHASAPQGTVVHLHDLLAWWPGHSQPYTLDALVALAGRDQAAALRLVDGGRAPRGADPRPALRALGAEIVQTALWRWPFSPDVDYLVLRVRRPPTGRCQPGTTPVTGAASSATGSGVKRYPTPKWVCT